MHGATIKMSVYLFTQCVTGALYQSYNCQNVKLTHTTIYYTGQE